VDRRIRFVAFALLLAAWVPPVPATAGKVRYLRDWSELVPGTTHGIRYVIVSDSNEPPNLSFGDRILLRVFTLPTENGLPCDSSEVAGVLGVDDLPIGLVWPLIGLKVRPEFTRPLVVDAELLGEWFGCDPGDDRHTIRLTVIAIDSSKVGQARPWVKSARLGLAAYRAGRHAESARLLEPGASKRPHDLAYQCLYADALQKSGQRDAYEKQVRKMAATSPERIDEARLKGWGTAR
jgi:hypothetical protein